MSMTIVETRFCTTKGACEASKNYTVRVGRLLEGRCMGCGGELPAKVERPAKVRETYTVDEADLLAFRHEAREAGMTIVCSAPIGRGYAVTIEHN